MTVHKTKLYKYSPLWYAVMSMKAFSNGDHMLTHQYFKQGQEILDSSGSLFLPLSQCSLEEAEGFSMSAECKTGYDNV